MSCESKRKSLRLNGYNYSQTGAYFSTICAQARKSLFGKVLGDDMHVNEYGKIIRGCWQELPSHYPSIQLDYFTVMPNHVHGIIFLVGAGSPRPEIPTSQAGGGTPPLQQVTNLSAIIGFFKFHSTKRINEIRHTPGAKVWQRGFYDHVIRDDESLNRIRNYIFTNPSRWHLDRENPTARNQDDFDIWLDSYKTSLHKRNRLSEA
jgi:REP element-mobilizing transposase RayT